MPSTRDIKRRQKSVKNTEQVTKAMEMVAAAKMRKAQQVALQSRPYAEKSLAILSHIKERQPDIRNIFLDGRPESKKILGIIITSDKGLAGGLNNNVLRESSKIFEVYRKDNYETEFILVGTKSRSHFERLGLPILETFKGAGDYTNLDQVKPISAFLQKKYRTDDFDKVIAVYTEFISTLKQKASRRQILPITTELLQDLIGDVAPKSGKYSEAKNAKKPILTKSEFIFEPTARAVLKNLIPSLLDIYVYHIILESNASEHSARMVAMKNASENAENILNELTLSYNKARQAAITGEITEITAGVEALQN